MTKYILAEETKPTKLVKQVSNMKLVPKITCPQCSKKTDNPGKRYNLASCIHCRFVFYNPTYDGY